MERKQLRATLHTYEGDGLYDKTNRLINAMGDEFKAEVMCMPEYWLHIPCGIWFEEPGVRMMKEMNRNFSITMKPIDSGIRIYAYVVNQGKDDDLPGYEAEHSSIRIAAKDVEYDTNLIKMGADIQAAIQCVMENVLKYVVRIVNDDPWSTYAVEVDWETTIYHFYTMMGFHTRRIGEYLEMQKKEEEHHAPSPCTE